MKTSAFLMLLFLHLSCFSQVRYEKGYFITNADERVECLIRNYGWIKTPSAIKYRMSKDEAPKTINLTDVKLVEIYNDVKFVRSKVNIDQSSDYALNMSTTENPEFVEQDVFLRELTSGDVKLFSFSNNDLKRFFYQVGNGNLEPLIYKPYRLDERRVAYNENYKKQLANILVCSTLTPAQFEDLEYSERSLVPLFIKYYRCSNDYTEKVAPKYKTKLNIYFRPRINHTSMGLTNRLFGSSYELGTKIGFGLGAEVELVLPFNKNKWAIFFEPQYESYKAAGLTDIDYVTGGRIATTVNYQSIAIPFGVRHYMFLNDKSSLFIHAQYRLNLPTNSSIVFKWPDGVTQESFEARTEPNFGFGLGYKYKKFSVEARYLTDRDISRSSAIWQSSYRQSSIIFGYQIF